jgi:hypothetical protein
VSKRHRTLTDPIGNRSLGLDGELLYELLDDLSEREAGIVYMYFGLGEKEPQTLDEIGKLYGVTRERIRQVLEKAISKLRHPSRTLKLLVTDSHGHLTDYIEFRRKHRVTEWDRRIYEKWRANFISCAHCGQQEFPSVRGGRPRKYCSDKCRQAAYRARRTQQFESRS